MKFLNEIDGAKRVKQDSNNRFVTDAEKAEWNSKWVYDEDTIKNVKVSNANNADKVNGKTVDVNVPSNAKFTDTTYGVATTSTNGLMSSTDKQNLDANTTSKHTHSNKVVIDKFTEVDNKPYYNGEEIGGAVPNLTLTELTLGGRFKIVYNDIEDSLDIEVI